MLCQQYRTGWHYRAFSCDVIAAMLEGKNNTFSLPCGKTVSLFQSSSMAAMRTLYYHLSFLFDTKAAPQ